MFREASVYALKRLAPQERTAYGLRVLTMRSWPRGIARSDVDLWIPSAAPLPKILAIYQRGDLTWEDFTTLYWTSQLFLASECQVRDYRNHLAEPVHQVYDLRPVDYLRQLEDIHGVVTLLCWERVAPCHRFLLLELLEHPQIEAEMRGGAISTTTCKKNGMFLAQS